MWKCSCLDRGTLMTLLSSIRNNEADSGGESCWAPLSAQSYARSSKTCQFPSLARHLFLTVQFFFSDIFSRFPNSYQMFIDQAHFVHRLQFGGAGGYLKRTGCPKVSRKGAVYSAVEGLVAAGFWGHEIIPYLRVKVRLYLFLFNQLLLPDLFTANALHESCQTVQIGSFPVTNRLLL